MMHIRLIILLLRRFHLDMSFSHWENAIHVYRFKPIGKNVKYAEMAEIEISGRTTNSQYDLLNMVMPHLLTYCRNFYY